MTETAEGEASVGEQASVDEEMEAGACQAAFTKDKEKLCVDRLEARIRQLEEALAASVQERDELAERMEEWQRSTWTS